MGLKIRGLWPENEGENEATVLDFFSADRPHGIHGFWSRKESRNPPLDLEKFLESGPQNSGNSVALAWMVKYRLILTPSKKNSKFVFANLSHTLSIVPLCLS